MPAYSSLLLTAHPAGAHPTPTPTSTPSEHAVHPVSAATAGGGSVEGQDGPTSPPRLAPVDASLPALLSQAHDLALASLAAASVRLAAAEKALVDLMAAGGGGTNPVAATSGDVSRSLGSSSENSGGSSGSGISGPSEPFSSLSPALNSNGFGASPRIRVLRPIAATAPTTLASAPTTSQPTPTNIPVPVHTHATGTHDDNCPTCGQTLTLDARQRRETEVRQSLVGLRADRQRLQVIAHPINAHAQTLISIHSLNTLSTRALSNHLLNTHYQPALPIIAGRN